MGARRRVKEHRKEKKLKEDIFRLLSCVLETSIDGLSHCSFEFGGMEKEEKVYDGKGWKRV